MHAHVSAHNTTVDAGSPALYVCPSCRTLTDALKRYRLYRFLLFAVVAWGVQTAEYTACPSCMRSTIVKLTLVNIVPANIAWPIVFILHAIDFARTYTSNTSKGVDARLRVG